MNTMNEEPVTLRRSGAVVLKDNCLWFAGFNADRSIASWTDMPERGILHAQRLAGAVQTSEICRKLEPAATITIRRMEAETKITLSESGYVPARE